MEEVRKSLELIERFMYDYSNLKLELEYKSSKIKVLEAENKALKMNLGIVTDDDMKHIPCID